MKPILICYLCRKRVSQDELAQHNHFDQQLEPPQPQEAQAAPGPGY